MTTTRSNLIFKLCISLYSLLLIILFSYQMYINQVQGRVTDENIFVNNKAGQVFVTNVTPDGASDRAGMLIGDTIVTINGQTFKTAIQADVILRNSKPGSLMDYKIKRGDQLIHLKVQAAKQNIQLRNVIGYLLLLEWLALALFVAFRRPERFAVRLFCTGIITIIPLIVSNFVFNVQPPLITIFLVIIGLFFGISVFIHSHFYFNRNEKINGGLNTIWIKVLYIIGSTGFVYFVVLLAMGQRNINFTTSREHVLLVILILYALYSFGLLLYLFAISYKKDPENKLLWFIWLVFYAGASMTGGLLVSFGYNQGSFLFLFSLYVPIVYFYIITKKRLFDINIVLKQSVQYKFVNYSVMILLIGIFTSILTYIIDIDIGETGFKIRSTAIEIGSTNTRGFTDRPLYLFIGGIGVILFVLLRKRVQSVLNKKYNRQGYDYKSAYAEISDVISTVTTVDELNNRVVNGIRNYMNLKSIVLFLPKGKLFEFVNCCDIDKDLEKELEGLKINPNDLDLKEPKSIDEIEILADFKQKLVFAIPLIIKEKLQGTLLLGGKLSDEVFNQADIDFVQSLAKQFAVALNSISLQADQKRNELLQQELNLAKDIQLSLLPKSTPKITGIEVEGYYQAAQEVGGDYYDFLQYQNGTVENAFTAVLGDVSGKGVSASLYMSRFQGVMRSIFNSGIRHPKALIESTNAMVCTDISKNAFVTCLCAEINADKKEMTVVRAGHLPLLYYSASTNKLIDMEPAGLGLGLASGDKFTSLLEQEKVSYKSGDIFFLYSDGISEAMNKDEEEYGFERISEVIEKHHDSSCSKIVIEIKKSINEFVGETQPHDDITFILIKCQ